MKRIYLTSLPTTVDRSGLMWVCGAILAGSACQNAVASALSPWGAWNNFRQYLREWLYDGSDRARPCQTELDVSLCFAPLLRWVLSWWRSGRLALAVDPTLKGDQTTAIVISVVYRGCAIPVAWRIHRATQRGSWMDPTVELLRKLAPAVPKEMTVIVLCDRGIASPKLWRQIRAQGWHPYMRYRKNVQLLRPRRPPVARTALRFPSRYSLDWPRHRLQHPHRKTPLHPAGGLVRRAGRTLDHPHRPAAGGRRTQLVRPALLDRTGLQGRQKPGLEVGQDQENRPGPHLPATGLVLSVATLLALAYGTRVEDAHDRRIAPGNLRTPPKTSAPRRRDPWGRPVRTVSIIRHGIDWLRRLLLRGRLWSRVWLLPEPWPEPKPALEVTRHAPT